MWFCPSSLSSLLCFPRHWYEISPSSFPWPSTQSRRPYSMVVKSMKASHLGLNTGLLFIAECLEANYLPSPYLDFLIWKMGIIIIVIAETSLAVQWLRLCTPSVGSSWLIPGQGARSHIPLLRVHMLKQKIPQKILWTSTKTWRSQINKEY